MLLLTVLKVPFRDFILKVKISLLWVGCFWSNFIIQIWNLYRYPTAAVTYIFFIFVFCVYMQTHVNMIIECIYSCKHTCVHDLFTNVCILIEWPHMYVWLYVNKTVTKVGYSSVQGLACPLVWSTLLPRLDNFTEHNNNSLSQQQCIIITTMHYHNNNALSQQQFIITTTVNYHNNNALSQQQCIITTTVNYHNNNNTTLHWQTDIQRGKQVEIEERVKKRTKVWTNVQTGSTLHA